MHPTSALPAPLDFLLPSHTTYGIGGRKDVKPPTSLLHLNPPYLEATIRDGLRTPPADDMGSIYPSAPYGGYPARQETYMASQSMVGGSYTLPGVHQGGSSQAKQNPYASQNQSYAVSSTATLRHDGQPLQQNYPRPASPRHCRKDSLVAAEEVPAQRKSTADMILPSLQIPSSINNSGGSLAEFAAQITCLFWFESADTLHKAEGISRSSSPVRRLRDEAIPCSGFRKWVVTILSTTQVTQNVILLALMFIYRLKTINPGVKGRSGSEYRLLTVALMLGNKFLDDNTYTNKTWADVSGISVGEIHVMEVEFLSNMRYSLLASKEQWEEWHGKLGKFWTYCDEATRAPVTLPSPASLQAQQPSLSSPPLSMQASPPSLMNNYPSIATPYSQQQRSYGPASVSPLPAMPDLRQPPRKRSYDHDAEEPVAKRVTRSTSSTLITSGMPSVRHDAPRLPVPNLTVSTSQAMNNTQYDSRNYAPNVPHLPPLNGRAMSTVYPTTPTWTPQLPMLTPNGHQNPHPPGPPSAGGYTTPSRRQSPHSVQELLSLRSSPTSANFPSHTLGHISPSFFLQQRSSPYKPVRHVNTLLYPQPSASMHNYSVSVDHMHYQPLGKRNDYRAGVVPDYSHPHYSHWPVLPQPNFNT
ncbi:cyclin [Phlyctema vagabunda]|uniref:Cyclin n=1 Tax=Phlyctema vagabunda TaxID=108571 RepID=A0ABR4PJ44_9HELO